MELTELLEEPLTEEEIRSSVQLVGDEDVDRFEALPRPTALFLHGVDDMSTKDITKYCNHVSLEKVEWINDSACNLAFTTSEQAQEALKALVAGENITVDHRALVPAKPFVNEQDISQELFIRVSTDEDVKERGARQRSRYYLIHGVEDDKTISVERQEARKEHRERMTKSGGDGRSVFSRLGGKVERRRSLSPSRKAERRSLSPSEREEREIPSHLKSRLGNINVEE